MLSDMDQVLIGGQQWVTLFDAGCCDQTIDGAGLDPLGPATLPQFSRGDIGLPCQRNQRKRLKEADQPSKLLLAPQAVQELL